jgi:hypothetical protein
MDQDDGTRHGFAVGVSLAHPGAGIVRLVLDDLEPTGRQRPEWDHWSFFTFIDLPEKETLSHGLREKEYAAIGQAILARLLALQAVESNSTK